MSAPVAVVTDIHANLPALEAALARIEELGVERIYCGGDLVGYGPDPNEVCALLSERQMPTIYGNYDFAIGRDLEDCGCASRDRHEREIGQLSVDWTLANTNEASKAFMRALPFDLRFEVAGKRVRTRPRLAEKGERVPLRRQARAHVRADRRPRRVRRARLRPYAQALAAGVRRGALRELRLGRQAEGR